MKWTPVLIDWNTSDRSQMDYTQDTIQPVNTSANTEGVSNGESDPGMSAEIDSVERLVMFVPEYTNFEHYLAYKYKVSTPGTHCYCNRCIGFLEMAHFNVIKTRNILYNKLVTLAKNNLRYRERYSMLYHQMTGFSVKFSDMPFDLPIIDNSCYDYQRPSPLVMGICHFRRRYEQLETCHVKTVQTKNTLRQQIDVMTAMNEDLLDKCDQLFAIMQEKISANSEAFDKQYQYDPEDSCPCHHNCSDCKEMIEGQIELLYRERSKYNTECETTMEEYKELNDRYKALILRATNSSRFDISRGPNDNIYDQYDDYFHLRVEPDEVLVEEYEHLLPHQDENSNTPRDRCGSCSYCALALKLINFTKVNRIFPILFDFKQEYSDLFEEYSNFKNRILGDC